VRLGAGDFGRALHSPLVTLAFDHEAAAAVIRSVTTDRVVGDWITGQ
jgi:hypothetical protein